MQERTKYQQTLIRLLRLAVSSALCGIAVDFYLNLLGKPASTSSLSVELAASSLTIGLTVTAAIIDMKLILSSIED